MSRYAGITIILVFLLCLSSVSLTALAPIPDVGPSGCVPAPGMPCGSTSGSSGTKTTTQQATQTKTTTPQTGGYTATKPDEGERTTDTGIPQHVEIAIKNYKNPGWGIVYDVYTGELPDDQACPPVDIMDCYNQCGDRKYGDCLDPCEEWYEPLAKQWQECYAAWNARHNQLMEAYLMQENQGYVCYGDDCSDEEEIDVPDDLKDSVSDNKRGASSPMAQLVAQIILLTDEAMTPGQTRDFTALLDLLNKAATSKTMSDAELEHFIGSLQKYLAGRIPFVTGTEDYTALTSAMVSLGVAIDEAKARGNTQLVNRLQSDFEKAVNDVIITIEKNKLEKGSQLTKEQIGWADNVIDGMTQGAKQMRNLGQNANADKAQKLASDLKGALDTSVGNVMDTTEVQLDLDDSKQRTIIEEMERKQSKPSVNKKYINQKLDEARVRVQEMLEANYRKTMTLEEFEAKNADYQASRDAAVNIFKEVLSQDKGNTEANFALGTIYRKENRKEDAKELYERAILGASPQDRQILINGMKDPELTARVLEGAGLAQLPNKGKVMNHVRTDTINENAYADKAKEELAYFTTKISKGLAILGDNPFSNAYGTVKGLFVEQRDNANVNEVAYGTP
ncbi:MAG: tetratricopeptide repeat protein [Candidatus Woesearchaeota archaeon]